MVDRHVSLSGTRDVFIGDRGYSSYKNMAHFMEKGQFFLFRTKLNYEKKSYALPEISHRE